MHPSLPPRSHQGEMERARVAYMERKSAIQLTDAEGASRKQILTLYSWVNWHNVTFFSVFLPSLCASQSSCTCSKTTSDMFNKNPSRCHRENVTFLLSWQKNFSMCVWLCRMHTKWHDVKWSLQSIECLLSALLLGLALNIAEENWITFCDVYCSI